MREGKGLWRALQGEAVGDDRLDADGAARHQADGRREGVGVAVHAAQVQLFREDRLDLVGDALDLGPADLGDDPGHGGDLGGEHGGRRMARRLEGIIGALVVGEREHGQQGILGGDIDGLGAQLGGLGQPGALSVQGDDLARPSGQRSLGHQQANGASAQHGDRGAGRDPGAVDGVHRHGHGLDGGALLPGHARRQGMSKVPGYGDIIAKSPVDARHGEEANVAALVVAAHLAVAAAPTGQAWLDADRLADAALDHALAQGDDLAGGLVARGVWLLHAIGAKHAPLVKVYVGAADAVGMDAHQHLACRRPGAGRSSIQRRCCASSSSARFCSLIAPPCALCSEKLSAFPLIILHSFYTDATWR